MTENNNHLSKLLRKLPIIRTVFHYVDVIEDCAETVILLSNIITKHDEILRKFDNVRNIMSTELRISNELDKQINRIDFRKIN